MLLKFLKEEENTHELVEPRISARRATYIGEKEESASHHFQKKITPKRTPLNYPQRIENFHFTSTYSSYFTYLKLYSISNRISLYLRLYSL